MLVTTACEGLTSGDAKPVAIEIVQPPDSIHIGDTVAIHVRVLNRAGDSIIGAPVALSAINPDTIGVDSAKTAVIGKVAGIGQVVASSGGFHSDIFRIPIK